MSGMIFYSFFVFLTVVVAYSKIFSKHVMSVLSNPQTTSNLTLFTAFKYIDNILLYA